MTLKMLSLCLVVSTRICFPSSIALARVTEPDSSRNAPNSLQIESLSPQSNVPPGFQLADQPATAESLPMVTIAEVNDHGTIVFEVVAAIATVFLPESVYGICMLTVGDPDICQTVYDATSVLVSLRGVGIYRGVTRGLNWIANRGKHASRAAIRTTTYKVAAGIKTVFDAYRQRECVNWETIEIASQEPNSEGSLVKGLVALNGPDAWSHGILQLINNEAVFDDYYTQPPHWKIMNLQGSIALAFPGKHGFYFRALGSTIEGKSYCFINVSINGRLHWPNKFINKNWTTYEIDESQFESGQNIVNITLVGNTHIWFDGFWVQ